MLVDKINLMTLKSLIRLNYYLMSVNFIVDSVIGIAEGYFSSVIDVF